MSQGPVHPGAQQDQDARRTRPSRVEGVRRFIRARHVRVAHGPVTAGRRASALDSLSAPVEEPVEVRSWPVRCGRQIALSLFNFWAWLSKRVTCLLGWYPRVEPYVGYGTAAYSRLICRTVYSPMSAPKGTLPRGIRSVFLVPAPAVQVRISIDDIPLKTVQVGQSELFDPVDRNRDETADFAISDTHGYLDLVATGERTVGVHNVSYTVQRRHTVHAPLYTISSQTGIGIISDLDDTIVVTDVPTITRAVVNMFLRSPHHRKAVPGMAGFYTGLHHLFPEAPFFYLSTSPWNVEASLRHFIRAHGFPEGPLLLRDLDPRPRTFIPGGVQHKLEFCEQLMADFPNMRFVLLGDDGQHDPDTYAQVARRYPGRVLAIGIRQFREQRTFRGRADVGAAEAGVPVFRGADGHDLLETMVPYLRGLRSAVEETVAGEGLAGTSGVTGADGRV